MILGFVWWKSLIVVSDKPRKHEIMPGIFFTVDSNVGGVSPRLDFSHDQHGITILLFSGQLHVEIILPPHSRDICQRLSRWFAIVFQDMSLVTLKFVLLLAVAFVEKSPPVFFVGHCNIIMYSTVTNIQSSVPIVFQKFRYDLSPHRTFHWPTRKRKLDSDHKTSSWQTANEASLFLPL